MKARIIERTYPDGKKEYVIQQRHFLFRWWWIDAGCNSFDWRQDTWSTLKEAQRNLCRFDGTPIIERVMPNNKN